MTTTHMTTTQKCSEQIPCDLCDGGPGCETAWPAPTAIDAAHCFALAETAPTFADAYRLWQESYEMVKAIGGPYASLVSIGGAR